MVKYFVNIRQKEQPVRDQETTRLILHAEDATGKLSTNSTKSVEPAGTPELN